MAPSLRDGRIEGVNVTEVVNSFSSESIFKNCASVERDKAERPIAGLEFGAWVVCGVSTSFAGYSLWNFRIAVDLNSLLAALGVLIFLIGVHAIYGRWRRVPTLRNLSGALAVIYWSAAMGGIISLVGLRQQWPLIDVTLANLDHVSGLNVTGFIEWTAAHPWWSHLLGVAYDSSFVQLFALAILLAVRSHTEKLWQLALVFAITMTACTSISVFWPAKGAFAYYNHSKDVLSHLPDGAGIYHLTKFEYFRHDPSPVLSFASLQGVVTFPSFHTCLALMTIFAAWGMRWLFVAALFWNGLVIISTLPIGGHYAIDLLCGALLWLAATATAKLAVGQRRWQSAPSLAPA
jgi:membrane-associated phospholipid phosphatase